MQNSKAVGYFVCWENLRDRIALRAVSRLMIQCSHTSLQREHGVEQTVKERKEVKVTDQAQLSLGMELAPTQKRLLVYTGTVGKGPGGHSVPTEGCDIEK